METPRQNIALYELQRRIALYEDESAYRDLFFKLYSPLKKFAAGFLHSAETAEEVVSDVFMEIWRRRSELMDIEDLKLYMYISVKNASLRRLQQLQKAQVISLDDFSYEFTSTYANAEDAMLTTELLQKIQSVVNELPPRCKLVYKLAKEDKLRYKDISILLNISVKTVDNQLATALKRIASAINFRLKKDPVI